MDRNRLVAANNVHTTPGKATHGGVPPRSTRAPSVKFKFTRAPQRRAVWAAAVILLWTGPSGALVAQDEPVAAEPVPLKQVGVSVTKRGGVELHVADMPLADVLQLLSLEGKRNIIASPNVTGSVTANLYYVTFDEALGAILTANGAGYRKIGHFTYVYTNDELAELADKEGEQLVARVFPLNYLTAKDANIYITPLLGEDERVAVSPPPSKGLESEATDGGGDMSAAQDIVLVVARPKTLDAIGRLLKQIDIRPRQVLIEATILRAELTEENALGIDFSIVGGVDLQLLGAASNAIQDITLGELPSDRFELFNAIASTTFADAVPGGGLSIGIIKDHVAVFLRALEQITDTTVLANPKVLALNRQKGQVIVGRRDGFLTTTVTETQAIQTVEFLETGTQLIFRPFIGNDGFIRMELHPEDSVGFVNAQGLPSEQTTEVTTNVLIRDGQTILIGGLFREVTTSANKQIPVLGNLKGIGSLFRSKVDSTKREEVIILLTVNIVKDQDAYAEASRELYGDMERIRVGSRQGLMWHGRDRVARNHYHKALDEQAAGDPGKALWHTRMALHNHPRFLPAIRLKERLLATREWDHEGGGVRDFLYRIIEREKGYPRQPFGRPGAINKITELETTSPEGD